MPLEGDIEKALKEAASWTADPGRAERNLRELLRAAPDLPLEGDMLAHAAGLFAASQFLANHCVRYPGDLVRALGEMEAPYQKGAASLEAREEFPEGAAPVPAGQFMGAIRRLKRRFLLAVTLRDIAGRTDLAGSMLELSLLAEDIIGLALDYSLMVNTERFGRPDPDGGLSLVAMGKLGGGELNYSSDVDLVAVYGSGAGSTSGILNPAGMRANRVSGHEFYCKVVEQVTRLLSTHTEDGIAYRVDLRLRPEGQRGQIALPLKSYVAYYESWGRTWERMALVRARPVAGNPGLGESFVSALEPFIWRRLMDYAEVEEIKAMKKKIDSTFARDDIKRGYGGIREAEFFVHTFQLLYGADNPWLRKNNFSEALGALGRLGVVPPQELQALGESYLFLRRVEHYLQMKDDLQAHVLPSGRAELECLGRKMGFRGAEEFGSELRLRRKQVKNMYNTLLGTEADIHGEAQALLEGDLNDRELERYLEFRGVGEPARCLQSVKSLREQTMRQRTMSELRTLRRVMPVLLEKALSSESPDRALFGLESFFAPSEVREAHLAGLLEHRELMEGLVKLFSLSSYLTRIFLSSKEYLNLLIEENIIRKTKRRMGEELRRAVGRAESLQAGVGAYKKVEDVRLGTFFLMKVLNTRNLMRYLSHLAECIVEVTNENARPPGGFAVVGMGKLGGREITFGSDLDLLFVSDEEEGHRAAELILRTLTAYTERGVLYEVDTRLRPDGSKGVLVKGIGGFRDYYLKHARNWEIQALLKARPVAGEQATRREFALMAREVVMERGPGVERGEIEETRRRILDELAREAEGLDVKLGPGGIEEIEFYVQWLQLRKAREAPEALVQSTPAAIAALSRKGVIGRPRAEVLSRAYDYYRTLETFMRLNDERPVVRDSEGLSDLAASFLGLKDRGELLAKLQKLRAEVLSAIS